MKWFKHQSDARNSLKLRKVRRKYGADGYAIYWFCLEAIAYDVDKDNLTFELKEDAETIGFELTIQEKRVMEIMEYMVEIGLFESSERMITCMKLAESIDKSMTNSPKMRKWLEGKSVMTSPDTVNTCAELEVEEEVEVEEEYKPLVKAPPKRSKFKFSDEDLRFAGKMLKRVLVVTPNANEPNLENWANTIRLMRESDKRDHSTMWAVFDWANRDSFWCSNVLSPGKLRKQFDRLQVKKNETNQSRNTTGGRKLSAVEENNARLLAKYGNPTPPGERTINPTEHTGMDSHEVSGGLREQVAPRGVTIDMDAGNIGNDDSGGEKFSFSKVLTDKSVMEQLNGWPPSLPQFISYGTDPVDFDGAFYRCLNKEPQGRPERFVYENSAFNIRRLAQKDAERFHKKELLKAIELEKQGRLRLNEDMPLQLTEHSTVNLNDIERENHKGKKHKFSDRINALRKGK